VTEYVLAPLEEPGWVVDAEELAAGLRERWPGVRIGVGTVPLEALIPLEPAPRELGVVLSGTGQAVSLEAADAEAAVEFSVWFFERFLAGRAEVHLIAPGSMRTVELSHGVTVEELLARLA
jgi:hypothetical protein